jgi:hypothetical protein
MNRLAEHRRALVEQSAAQRAAILAVSHPFLRKAAAADRLLTRVRNHPLVVTAVAASVVILGTRKLFDIASRAVTLYMLFRR